MCVSLYRALGLEFSPTLLSSKLSKHSNEWTLRIKGKRQKADRFHGVY